MALGICVSRVVPKNSKEAAHTFEKIIFSLRNTSQAIAVEEFEQRSRPHVLMLITCEILDFIARRVAAKDPEAPRPRPSGIVQEKFWIHSAARDYSYKFPA